MSSRDPNLDEIAGARAYEALHVPSVFRQWCPWVLDAAHVGPGVRVLDVACGTGVLARAAAERVGDAALVSGVDPGRGMLTVAREIEPAVDWRQGTAEALPFPDDSFDAVVSQFGLMFFADRPRAVREMMRVLRPGGRLAIAVWDRLEASEAYPEEVELLDRLAGKAAANALRAPFVLGDKEALIALLEAAGTESVELESREGTARFPSIRTMVEADLRGWLPVMGVVLREDLIERILAEAETVLARYRAESGEVVSRLTAHIAGGRRGTSG